MSKKIFTVLAPVAAIVVFVMAPSLAQANQVQCGASECANGTAIRLQSTNLSIQFQNPDYSLICQGAELQGKLPTTQAETTHGDITGAVLMGCERDKFSIAIAMNESSSEPWQLQVQQPVHQGTGAEQHEQVTAHITPFTGKKIEIAIQLQVSGFSVGTCRYSASSIQLMGEAQSDELEVEGAGQFTLQERNGLFGAECGTVNITSGDLQGKFQLETDNAAKEAVVVHMS
jgi:hypothetical protein